MNTFRDRYNRRIDYLRVSITDRCNLRCVYCMPKNKLRWKRHDQILRLEEIIQVIKASNTLGIRKIRITGGEPLVRRGAAEFVGMIRQNCRPDEICMTTNGILLKRYAQQLYRNGLDRINISLDTLNAEKFERMTRSKASLEDVFEGIRAAASAGFERIKINVVVIGGVNDDEIEDFVQWAADNRRNIRFIELMPTGSSCFDHKRCFVPASEIKKRVEKIVNLDEVQNSGSVADEYPVKAAGIRIGFIRAVSQPFCRTCNRLRLTAAGILKPCLYSDFGIDLLPLIRTGASQRTLREKIKETAYQKPRGHHIGSREYCLSMNQIGG